MNMKITIKSCDRCPFNTRVHLIPPLSCTALADPNNPEGIIQLPFGEIYDKCPLKPYADK